MDKVQKLEIEFRIEKIAGEANALRKLGAPREVWERIYIALEECQDWQEEQND